MGKGVTQSLEAVITILMVLTIFALIFTSRQANPQSELARWKLMGFNAVKSLDEDGQLRYYVLANDTQAIKEKLGGLMPAGVDFDVFICGSTCALPNASAERIASASYLLAGDAGNFSPKELVLYIW
jgi:hypothetical protein